MLIRGNKRVIAGTAILLWLGSGAFPPVMAGEMPDYSQWAYEWDLEKVDLADLRQTIQWRGLKADERVIYAGSHHLHLTRIRTPNCYRAIHDCSSA